MNTYYKFCENVFLAKCEEKHEKGDIIPVTTKYGKENDSIIFNLIAEKDGFFYYSIIRADGMNTQEWAKKKAERWGKAADNAEKKSTQFYETSHKLVEHIPLGQPILVGHHSEGYHRRTLDRSWNAMGKSIEMDKKAAQYESKAEFWERKSTVINLSMPESIEYFEYKLQKAKEVHEGLKNGTIPRAHSFSLTYAKKEVNDLEGKLKMAVKLWGDENA